MDGTPGRNRHYIAFTRPRERCLQRGAIAMARDLPARAVFNGPKPVQTGRDVKGRFMPGAPPGPGRPANPYARQQAALRVAVLEEVDEGNLRAIVWKLLRLAKLGNLGAVKLLFEWVIGAPPEPTHPDFVAAHDFEARRAQPSLIDALSLAERVSADDYAEEAPAAEDEELPPAPLHPQLQAMLSWAVQKLAEAQTRAAIPPPDPMAGWETFAASRLHWDGQAAVPLEMVFLGYARWAAARGEPVLAEEKVLAWLTGKGATVRTGTYCQLQTVAGVRLVE
jgi:hypothetical protein